MHSARTHTEKSAITGNGLFASRPLKKGEFIVVLKGREVRGADEKDDGAETAPNLIGIGRDLWLDSPLGNYLNHSCDPSAGIKGTRTLYALRSLKQDDEITIDYSTTEIDMKWTLHASCKCGAKGCRGTIRSIQYLPKRVSAKYLPYINTYFQRVYERYHGIKKI